MKRRKFHASSPHAEETVLNGGKRGKLGLPFIRTSNPVKRCPSPGGNIPEEREDPFSHLLYTNNLNSDQTTNPHGDASKSLGSMAGRRVCRRESGSYGTAAFKSTSRISVLPSFDKLMTKKRGAKRKQKNTSTEGPWKNVDEHVAQLRRKAACLNRSTAKDTITVQKPIRVEVKTKDEPKWNPSQPSCSQDITSCRIDLLHEITAAISAAHQPDWEISHKSVSLPLLSNSSHMSVSLPVASNSSHKSISLPVASNMNSGLPKSSKVLVDSEGPPAWKPALVVGKSPGISSDEMVFKQEWHDKVDQEKMTMASARKSPDVTSTFQPLADSAHTSTHSDQDNSEPETRFTFLPQLTEGSFQRVPGSEHLDLNSLSSPWPNMWSPPPQTDKNHEE